MAMVMDLINPPTIMHQTVDTQATDHLMIKDSMDIHQVVHKTINHHTIVHKVMHHNSNHNNHPGPIINTFHHNQTVNDQMAMATVTSIHKTVTDTRSHHLEQMIWIYCDPLFPIQNSNPNIPTNFDNKMKKNISSRLHSITTFRYHLKI